MLNLSMLSFLSTDTLKAIKVELEYYLPEIVTAEKEKEFCQWLLELNLNIVDENRHPD
jgi:hypothetical protein